MDASKQASKRGGDVNDGEEEEEERIKIVMYELEVEMKEEIHDLVIHSSISFRFFFSFCLKKTFSFLLHILQCKNFCEFFFLGV